MNYYFSDLSLYPTMWPMITKKMISVIAFQCFKKVRGEGNCTIAEDFNIHVGRNPEDYEVQHGGYIY